MKKTITLLVVAIITAASVSGKVLRRQLSIFQGAVPETETLATGKMEFVYKYSCCVDTTGTLGENMSTDNMLLQIGADGISKFSSYKNLTVDSLIVSSSPEQIADAAMEGRLSNGDPMIIFKNYPSGKLTHTEKVCMDWMSYEEEIPVLKWVLTDSVATVLGYECLSAKCNFRGREWSVFYTEEIPLAEGPWKLHGLPGLIMKATDTDGHYTFECIGIKSDANRPITIYKVPYNNVSRSAFYDTKHRYDINPFGYYEATTGGHITVTDEAGNISLNSHDVEELTFDYIERDWRK